MNPFPESTAVIAKLRGMRSRSSPPADPATPLAMEAYCGCGSEPVTSLTERTRVS